MARLKVFLIFSLFFASLICRANNVQIPSPWVQLRALEPNKETYVYFAAPKENESSFSVQVHSLSDKRIQKLKDQFEKSDTPKSFGALKVLGLEKEELCYVLSLGKEKWIEEKQTWCFDDTKAYAGIEQGVWHLPTSFVKARLQNNGWKFPR